MGAVPKPPFAGSNSAAERLHRLVEHLRVDRLLPRGHDGAAQVLADAARHPPHLLGLGGPHLLSACSTWRNAGCPCRGWSGK